MLVARVLRSIGRVGWSAPAPLRSEIEIERGTRTTIGRLGEVTMEKRLLIDHDIAGLYHHTDRDDIEARTEGEPLVLVREPENRYDSFAVRIDTKAGEKLGYVPRTYSRIVSTLVDLDFKLITEVGDFIDPKKGICHFRLWLEC